MDDFFIKMGFDGRTCLWVVPDMSQDHTVDVYELRNDFFWKNCHFSTLSIILTGMCDLVISVCFCEKKIFTIMKIVKNKSLE